MSSPIPPVQAKAELWRELCKQAVDEQDPTRLLTLVQEINRILEEKEVEWKKELWL
jgi:hypothetical protein